MTYTALSGERKQSVEDVERLFSQEMVDWMETKGYSCEIEYLQAVRGWSAVSQLNMQLLDYIFDDLTPWHCDANMNDFSLLEGNRYVRVYVNVVRGCMG